MSVKFFAIYPPLIIHRLKSGNKQVLDEVKDSLEEQLDFHEECDCFFRNNFFNICAAFSLDIVTKLIVN